ncbi:MAG: lysylphosphatidylglycerol synthase transmembrane domain-containing protein [Elusimicrobiota bacterium]
MKRLKRSAGMGLALVVGGALLFYAFKDIRPREVLDSLSDFRPAWLPVLLVFPLIDLLIRALRWSLLLAPMTRAGVWTLTQLEAIGLAVNNVLFLRLGEVARSLVAAQEFEVPVMSVLATIVVERLCDMAAILLLFVVGASFMPDLVEPRLRALAAGLTLLILAALGTAAAGGERLARAAARLRGLPSVGRMAGELVCGTRALRSWSVCFQVGFWSLALWIWDAAYCSAIAASMGFEPGLGLGRAILVLCTAAAGTMLPTVPGAFGNFEASVRFILERFGYDRALAVSYAMVSHLLGYAIVTLLGVLFLYKLGHTFESLRRALTEAPAAGGRP